MTDLKKVNDYIVGSGATLADTAAFLTAPGARKTMTPQETMIEQGRFIVHVISQISFSYNMEQAEVYQLLKQTNTIEYMMQNWNILHTFDLLNATEHVIEHAINHGGKTIWI